MRLLLLYPQCNALYFCFQAKEDGAIFWVLMKYEFLKMRKQAGMSYFIENDEKHEKFDSKP